MAEVSRTYDLDGISYISVLIRTNKDRSYRDPSESSLTDACFMTVDKLLNEFVKLTSVVKRFGCARERSARSPPSGRELKSIVYIAAEAPQPFRAGLTYAAPLAL